MPTKKPTGLYQSNGRGSWVIDRRFKGVGEIRRATGTNSISTAQAINGMLTSLYQVGRLDLLKRIKSGDLWLLEAYSLHMQGDLLTAGKREGLRTIRGWEHWIARHNCSEAWRLKIKYWLKRLLTEDMRYEELPDRLRALSLELQGKAPMFKQAKSALLTFVKHTLGPDKPAYTGLLAVPWMSYSTPMQASFSLPELAEFLRSLEEKPMLQDDVRSLALSGMGPKEYIKDGWEILEDRIQINGQKRRNRIRVIPLAYPITRPNYAQSTLYDYLRARGHAAYELRRTYARLLEHAGVPRTRRRAYLGHLRSLDQSDDYERHEVTAYLQQDAERIRTTLKAFPDVFPDRRTAIV